MAEALLEINELAVAANGVRLLEGISIALRAGELIAITGPSGCGKSTLLRAIAGLIDPVEGAVMLRGEAPEVLGWPAFRRRVTLVSQRPVVFEGTVRENLARVFRYATASKGFDEARASELLDALRVESGRLTQDALSLSEGQRQRICLIRALLTEPDVLLLDEPSSALDDTALKAVETAIRQEAEQRGLGALIVSHERGQLAEWCDRAVDLTDNGATQ